MEPFWDLNISKYVEYLTRASSEYLISCVLSSLTSTASRILLAYVIQWINIASLELHIACPYTSCMQRAMPRPT